MNYKSSTKLQENQRHRPKNLPTIQFIQALQSLCEGTSNQYDARNHVLTIRNLTQYTNFLQQRLHRSRQSFEKQLKMLGFKKNKQIGDDIKNEGNNEYERQPLKYYWKGRKEEYLTKELLFSENHLTDLVTRIHQFKDQLILQKTNLDLDFQNSIFWGLKGGCLQKKTEERMLKTIEDTKKIINYNHRRSIQFVKDIQENLDSEISLLRLLAYRQNDVQQQ